MSGKLPALTGAEIIRALEREGFTVVRVRGSHHFLRHPDGRATVVASHSGETIGPGLMSKILRDCGLDRAQFRRLLQSKRHAEKRKGAKEEKLPRPLPDKRS